MSYTYDDEAAELDAEAAIARQKAEADAVEAWNPDSTKRRCVTCKTLMEDPLWHDQGGLCDACFDDNNARHVRQHESDLNRRFLEINTPKRREWWS